MRSVILDLARELGLAVRIGAVALTDVRDASEVFVCNTLIGIWPVQCIDGVALYPVGPITRRLAEALAGHRDSRDGQWYSS
jgi:4-amino-4-deoxychorismate lyase